MNEDVYIDLFTAANFAKGAYRYDLHCISALKVEVKLYLFNKARMNLYPSYNLVS